MSQARSLKSVLGSRDSQLRKLLQRSDRLRALEAAILKLLPVPLDQHCRLANVNQAGVLVLQATSTAWATRLRYQAPALLAQLRKRHNLAYLNSIKVTIQPREAAPLPAQPAHLSPSAAATLEAAAQATTDIKLAAALHRLAGRRR